MSWILDYFYSESTRAWAYFTLAAISGSLALTIIRYFAISKIASFASKTENKFDDLLLNLLENTKKISLIFFSFYAAFAIFKPIESLLPLTNKAFIVVLCLQLCLWANGIVGLSINLFLNNDTQVDPAKVTTLNALALVVKLLLWVTIFLLALHNFGVNVSALIAGLGVGGIAVALAVQNILVDLLASLSIALDKPFVIGDLIMVGTDSGTVEHIGLKTTRLRSPSGEQLIFSNSELLKSRIKNYKRMPERNVTAVLSLDYNTPLEKLEKVPTIIENIFKDIPHSRLNRCHLARLGSSALEFEILYSVLSQDPILHIQSQNKLNFLLLEKLHEQKITIPFPTQTIRIESQT